MRSPPPRPPPGADVVLVTGPVALPPLAGITTVQVESARQMRDAVEAALPPMSGFSPPPSPTGARTMRRTRRSRRTPAAGRRALELAENPDILASVASSPERPGLLIGFAAETRDVIDHARAKRARKNVDWIVANDVSPQTGVMGGDANTVHLIDAHGVDSWPTMSKEEVAERLVERIGDYLEGVSGGAVS